MRGRKEERLGFKFRFRSGVSLKVSAAVAVISVMMVLGIWAAAAAAAPAGSGGSGYGQGTAVTVTINGAVYGTGNGSVTVNTTGTGTGNESVCTSNGTKMLAEGLLIVVERLSNVTARLINGTNFNSSVAPSNRTMLYYSTAKKYQTAAVKEYNMGEYCLSIRDSFKAMHYYRLAIMSLKLRVPARPAIYYEAKGELRMMASYSVHVRHLIGWLSLNGVNVTNVSRLYNETLAAYRKVAQDLRDNNMTALRKDLTIAHEKRTQLDAALRRAMGDVIRHQAKLIVNRFLNWTRMEIQALEAVANETNMTWMKIWISFLTSTLEQLYKSVEALANSSRYMAALAIIEANLHPIKHSALLAGIHHSRNHHSKTHRGRDRHEHRG
ncbi:MAG: hypothetical protein GXO14_03505 [Thermococci archaeon]|nr:hypothetical protein [Thermococci archaeon]